MTEQDDSRALVAVPEDEDIADKLLQPELSNIRAIPTRKTVMAVNSFVVQTTGFINSFAVLCESRLRKISQDIGKLQVTLAILEGKLSSIDWLASRADQQDSLPSSFDNSSSSSGVPAAPPVASAGAGGTSAKDHPASAPQPAASVVSEAVPESASASDIVPVSQDPTYSHYFKMLKIGAPKMQLKDKMEAGGLDPAILDMDPMDPTPSGLNADSLALVLAENAEDSSSGSEISDMSD